MTSKFDPKQDDHGQHYYSADGATHTSHHHFYMMAMLGFIFVIMAIDHALHAYSENYGLYWFFKDYKRTVIFDYCYLIDQSIIMPVLFFCFGHRFANQIKNRSSSQIIAGFTYQYVIPFIIGFLIFVPLLVFPRYAEHQDPNISLSEFYTSIYFENFIQAGPFWVMYALVLYSTIVWLCYRVFPQSLMRTTKKLTTNPLLFIGLNTLILFLSDTMWGAPWWIGFGKLFYLQGARFISNFLFFCVGFSWYSNRLQFKNINLNLKLLNVSWILMAFIIAAGFYYCDICINQDAYPLSLKLRFNQGYNFWDAVALVQQSSVIVLRRTAALSILMYSLFLLILKTFESYKNFTVLWLSLSTCCYGIFIFHEPVTVWLQFMLVDSTMHPVLKALCVFIPSVLVSWFITLQVMRFRLGQKVLRLDNGDQSTLTK